VWQNGGRDALRYECSGEGSALASNAAMLLLPPMRKTRSRRAVAAGQCGKGRGRPGVVQSPRKVSPGFNRAKVRGQQQLPFSFRTPVIRNQVARVAPPPQHARPASGRVREAGARKRQRQ